MGVYEPSPELRRAAEEYVNMLSEKDIDEAIAQHNAHEDGFDDYGAKKPKKKTKKK